MPPLQFNQYHKSKKTPFIIYADFESLVGKISQYRYNPKILSTTKIGEHIPSGFFNVYNIVI